MKVSALLSTYNNEKVIRETVDSVLKQTYKDFEFIIVNDGSTDSTKDILESYEDTRIHLINLDTNVGIGNALNIGLNHCQGKYVIKIDGDDVQDPKRFVKQIEFMEMNPNLAMSKSAIEYFADDLDVEHSARFAHRVKYLENLKNRNKTPEEIKESLMWHCSIAHEAMIIKTEVIKRFKYKDFYLFEDYDLFYRLTEAGYLIGHLDEKLVKVRVSNDSVTATAKTDIYYKIAYEIKKDAISKFSKDKKIYLWGSGGYAKSLGDFLKGHDWKIEGYIDSFKYGNGLMFENKFVYSPEIVKKEKIKIVIAASTGLYEIIEYLKKCGYETNKDFFVLK